MSRRALLAGGAVALLATGCGEEEEAVTAPADALRRQLEAEAAFAAATSNLPDGAPRSAAGVVREVHARARARAEKLAAVTGAALEGGDAAVAADEAIARGQAAIVAHVVALPSLSARERRLGAELVTGAAADTAVLSDALRLPVQDAFPGTPT